MGTEMAMAGTSKLFVTTVNPAKKKKNRKKDKQQALGICSAWPPPGFVLITPEVAACQCWIRKTNQRGWTTIKIPYEMSQGFSQGELA